jgi:exopolyphosphatase/pppGpp-phosphohydrolase
MFVSSPSATVAWARITQRIMQALEAADHETKFACLLQRPPDLAIALGSAITFYARDEIASIEGRKPTMRNLHGQSIDPDQILRYLGRIQPTLDQMKLTPSAFAHDSDEALVLSGLVLFGAVAQKYAISEYRISRSGMRYGVLSWRAGKRVILEMDSDAGQAIQPAPVP